MKLISIFLPLALLGLTFAACKKETSSSSPPPSSAPLPISSPSASAKPTSPLTQQPLPTSDVLFADQDRPVSIGIHGDFIYWINAGTGVDNRLERAKGKISRGSKGGGDAKVLFSGQNLPDAFAIGEKELFWTCEYDVFRGPIAGGQAILTFNGSEVFGSPMALTLREDRLIFGVIHPDKGGLLVLDTKGKRLMDPVPVAGGVSALAVSKDAIFAYSREQRAIGKIPLEGGPPKTVATDIKGCATLLTDDSNLYWTEPGDGRVRTMSVDGGEPKTLSEGYTRPWDLVIDSEVLWLTDREAGTIVRVPKSGGRGMIVAKDLGEPHRLAFDESHVYWTNPEKGVVARVAKP